MRHDFIKSKNLDSRTSTGTVKNAPDSQDEKTKENFKKCSAQYRSCLVKYKNLYKPKEHKKS